MSPDPSMRSPIPAEFSRSPSVMTETFRPPRRRTTRLVRPLCIVVVMALASLAPSAARAEDGFFGRALKGVAKAVEKLVEVEEAPVAREAVMLAFPGNANNVDRFTPLLKQLLKIEMAYLVKVCHPNDEQKALIRKQGDAAVADIAKKMMAAQNGRRGNAGFPDARKLMTDALHKALVEAKSDKATDYAQEIAAREAARKEAGVAMMTAQIDRTLFLAPDQHVAMAKVIEKNWKDEWSRNTQAFLYIDYLPTPDVSVLSGAMNNQQQAVWKARPNYGTISFGWEGDLGLNNGFVDAGVDEEEAMEAAPAEGAAAP